MLWRRKVAKVGDDANDLPSTEAYKPRSGVPSASIQARLELIEDGRIVYSRPIFAIPSISRLNEPPREISTDLDAGRRLGAGGFVAIDFETATSSRDSACAVAVAAVESGRVTDISRWLIQPPGNRYEPFNEAIHGITPQMTAQSPSMGNVWPEVLAWIRGRPLVTRYAPFDLSVLRHSAQMVRYPYGSPI